MKRLLLLALLLPAARPALDDSSCSPIDFLEAGAPATDSSITLTWPRPYNWDDDSMTYHGRYSESDPGADDPMDSWWGSATPIQGLPDPQAMIPDQWETHVVTGLLPGRTYYFFLRVEESDGSWNQHPGGNVASGATAADPVLPGTPAGLAGTPLGPNSIRCTWTASGDDGAVGTVAGYSVKVSTNPDTSVPATWWAGAAPATATNPLLAPSGSPDEVTVGNLQASTTYTIGLRALDDGGNPSAIAFVSATTTAGGGASSGASEGSGCAAGALPSAVGLLALLVLARRR